MKKKLISLLCAAAMVFSLAACGTKTDTTYAGQTLTGRVTAMDGTAIDSTEQVQSLLAEAAGQETTLTVRRGSSTLALTACARPGAGGAWQLGAWIRDSMAGIGTLTYYDPATGQYGALGHGITDVDTAQLMPLASGSIMETTVKAVKKGRKGDPGATSPCSGTWAPSPSTVTAASSAPWRTGISSPAARRCLWPRRSR